MIKRITIFYFYFALLTFPAWLTPGNIQSITEKEHERLLQDSLLQAVNDGHNEKISAYLANPHLTECAKSKALHCAISNQNNSIVALLLDHEIPCEVHHLKSAVSGKSVEIVKQLIEHGANPKSMYSHLPHGEPTETMLHAAAASGTLAIVNLLISHGVDATAINWSGKTAASEAIHHHNKEAVIIALSKEERRISQMNAYISLRAIRNW